MVEKIDTPCVGGPKNGKTIRHAPDDLSPRVKTNGKYVYVPAIHEPGKSHGDGWVWHQFIEREVK